MSEHRRVRLSQRVRPTLRRMWVATLAVSLLPAVAVLGLAGAPSAHADEPFAVTSSGLAVSGHGWGHGLGMSQWGAQGAALQGVGYRQILSTYYPNTSVGSAAGTMAVRIDAAGTSQTAVAASSGLTATDTGDGATWTLPSGPTRWRVVLAGSGAGWLESFDGSAWSRWAPPDGRAYLKGILRFQNGPISIVLTDGSLRRVRGVVDAVGTGGGAIMTVNTVSLEDYVRGVVGAEVSSSWKPEALKAQSVAARTFGVSRRDTASGGYQICSTDACQVYRGIDVEAATVSAAVDATAGEVLLSGGRAATTMFSSSNGGYSVAGSAPYLVARADAWDEAGGQNPNRSWSTTVSQSALTNAFGVGTVTRVRVLARDGNGEWGGRVTSVAVDGSSTSTTVSGTTFQSKLGLKSTWWTGPAPAAPPPDSAIITRWKQLGGDQSVLGPIASAEYAVPNGAAQDFARGTMYWSRWTGAFWAWGDIKRYYLANGGTGGLFRFPVTDELNVVGGAGQDFEQASVYWTAEHGSVKVWGAIKDKYDRFRIYPTDQRDNHLGLPVGEEYGIPGGVQQDFARGHILWSGAAGAHPVNPPVYDRWVAQGGLNGLGFPLDDYDWVNLRYLAQQFQVGQIVPDALSSAMHVVWGGILQEWTARGAANGALGFPVGEEAAVGGAAVQVFAHGVIAWRPTGTTVVWGEIAGRYATEGGATGRLGLPLANEEGTPTGAQQRFEHGTITWDRATNTTQVTVS